MPTSTEVLVTCPVCGPDVEVTTFAGTRFCAKCLARFLKRFRVSLVEMRRFDKVYGEPRAPGRVCEACGEAWTGGTACPKCGTGA